MTDRPSASPDMRPQHVAVATFVMALWGLNFVVAKVGLEQLPPIFFMFLRFAVVAVVLGPFVARPSGQWGKILAISVTLGLLHFSLMFTGLKVIDASTAAIAIQLQVPLAAVLAWLILGDRLGWRRAIGMAIAFCGVVLIAGEPKLRGDLIYLLMIIAAAAIWSVGAVQIKRLEPIDGVVLNTWIAIFASPQLLVASLILEDGQWQALQNADLWAWLAVLYQSVLVYGLGYGLWFWLLARYQVNQTMPFLLLVPLFGVAAGVVFLGEALTLLLILGGLLTVGGVAIVTLWQSPSSPPKARP